MVWYGSEGDDGEGDDGEGDGGQGDGGQSDGGKGSKGEDGGDNTINLCREQNQHVFNKLHEKK